MAAAGRDELLQSGGVPAPIKLQEPAALLTSDTGKRARLIEVQGIEVE